MITIVDTFRKLHNAARLQAALKTAGIASRVLSQGAVWNVYVGPHDHDVAFNISLGTIYV